MFNRARFQKRFKAVSEAIKNDEMATDLLDEIKKLSLRYVEVTLKFEIKSLRKVFNKNYQFLA